MDYLNQFLSKKVSKYHGKFHHAILFIGLFSLFYPLSLSSQTFNAHEIDSLQAVLTEMPADTNRINLIIRLQHAMQLYDIEKSRQYDEELLELSQKLNFPKGLAGYHSNKAYYYMLKNEYGKSLEEYYRTLDILFECNYLKPVISIYNNIGNLYARIENWEKAIEFFSKSMLMAKEKGRMELYSVSLSNMASCYTAMGDYGIAISFYRQALKIDEISDDLLTLAFNYSNIGHLYFLVEMPEKAIEFLNKGRKYYEQIEREDSMNHELNSLLTTNRFDMADYYLEQQMDDSAFVYYKKALSTASRNDILDVMANSHYGLYSVFLKKKDFKNALLHYVSYNELEDSLKRFENEKSIHDVELRYELERRQLEAQNELNKRKRIWMFIAFVMVSVLAILQTIVIGQRRMLFKSKRKEAELKSSYEDVLLKISEKNKVIDSKCRDLDDVSMLVMQKNDFIQMVLDDLKSVINSSGNGAMEDELKHLIWKLNNIINHNQEQNLLVQNIHDDFSMRLKERFPHLKDSDCKLAMLIRLNISNKEIATIFNINVKSVIMKRYRLRKMLKMQHEEDLNRFLSEF